MDFPKRDGAVAGLPDDPLVEILSRVPVKSLCRFKCVSKGWRDLISDPLHRRKLPQTLEGFFHGIRRKHGEIHRGEGGDVGDGGCSGCSYWFDYVFIDMMGRSVPLVDPSFSFLTEELPGLEHVRILHSCNGLLLLRHGPDPYIHTLGYVVCNPATEEWVAVPNSGWEYSDPPERDGDKDSVRYICEYTFLIFDPAVSSHFRLLQFLHKIGILNEVGLRTYSSETGVWTDRSGELRSLDQGGQSPQLGSFGSVSSSLGSAFINGMLHFIANHIQKDQELIVVVDWEGKTHRVISWPQFHGCSRSEPAFVGQSQGRLCCISEHRDHNSTQITIWVLEDYEKEEWVMKDRVSSFQLFGSVKWLFHFDYIVVAIHPDRNLIFIYHRGQKLISYNMDNKEVHTVSALVEGYEWTPYVPYLSESPVLSKKH
ncbi:unnamed protein product [Urochloa decumbens]|uniref:F-box domain-containing protein n=1 Tax=Urochloa decumbens TaxID=240449 RepID=A0ABC9H8H2_9POAL